MTSRSRSTFRCLVQLANWRSCSGVIGCHAWSPCGMWRSVTCRVSVYSLARSTWSLYPSKRFCEIACGNISVMVTLWGSWLPQCHSATGMVWTIVTRDDKRLESRNTPIVWRIWWASWVPFQVREDVLNVSHNSPTDFINWERRKLFWGFLHENMALSYSFL